MFVFLCVHAHPCVYLLRQHILVVEPLSLGSRQDPLHRAGSGICLYLTCQGQSRSLKQSQEKYPDLLTLLLPQGCCFIFFFLVASRICSLQCVCKKLWLSYDRVRKRAKNEQRFLWVVTQPSALTLHSWALQPAWECWAARAGAIGSMWAAHVMLFAPRSVPVLICGSSVHRHEEALNLALCFTYLHFCSVEAVVTLIKSELYNGG